MQQQIVGSYEGLLLDPMRDEPCIKVAMVSKISEIDYWVRLIELEWDFTENNI